MSEVQEAWHDLEQTVITCRKCPRLVDWREEVASNKSLLSVGRRTSNGNPPRNFTCARNNRIASVVVSPNFSNTFSVSFLRLESTLALTTASCMVAM